ncbi:MAG: apolipoprotein N-acyltransferase [Gemmatimonadota bacterium]|nr:apolipoprotein N-acyltransferase [Gemmatimonadota bacterium]
MRVAGNVTLRPILLAAASGVLVGATFSPHGGPVLPFLAFAPLAFALRSNSQPFAPGFVTAALAHGIGLYWMIPALSWRTALAVPVYLLVLVMIGIVAGAATTGAVNLHRARRWPLPLSLAMCWTGLEWTAAHVPGVSYAWLNAGGSLAWYPPAAAGAELLGVRLLTVWTVACGAVVAGAAKGRWADKGGSTTNGGRGEWLRGTPGRALLLAGLVGIPLTLGSARQQGFTGPTVEDPLLRVAMVQAGHGRVVAGDESGNRPEAAEGVAQWIEPLRALRQTEHFDIAVFPERHVAATLRDPAGSTVSATGREAAGLATALGVPLIVGALDGQVTDAGADTLWYNAAFALSPDGTPSRAYRKRRLVPGLEAAGLVGDPFGARNRGYAAGREALPLTAGGNSVGAMVCYDSAYGETARALVRAGAEWLAVLSNDDWLDPDLPLRVTWAYWQHATHGRLRAIENRIGLVQVASTGYTFAVTPAGTGPESLLEPGAEGIAVAGVGHRATTTLFTRVGDVLGLACFVVFVGGLFTRSGRNGNLPPPPTRH